MGCCLRKCESLDTHHVTGVRFFAGDKKKRAGYMRKFRARWDNHSHFIRCACMSYMRQLDRELLDMKFQKTKVN